MIPEPPLPRPSPPSNPFRRPTAPQPIPPMAPAATVQPNAPLRINLGAIADALAAALSDEADLRGLRP